MAELQFDIKRKAHSGKLTPAAAKDIMSAFPDEFEFIEKSDPNTGIAKIDNFLDSAARDLPLKDFLSVLKESKKFFGSRTFAALQNRINRDRDSYKKPELLARALGDAVNEAILKHNVTNTRGMDKEQFSPGKHGLDFRGKTEEEKKAMRLANGKGYLENKIAKNQEGKRRAKILAELRQQSVLAA